MIEDAADRLGSASAGAADDDAPWDEAADLRATKQMARACLEDIAGLSGLCGTDTLDPWSRGTARFEERLVANLDALCSLSDDAAIDGLDVALEAERFADEMPVPDPGRAFARAFVLGCLEDARAVDAAIGALRRSDPRTHDRQVQALSLASNPAIAGAMRALARDARADLVRIAVDVLRLRREATAGDLAALVAHADAGVRAAAARALSWVPERDAAIALLLEMANSEGEAPVIVAIAESLLCLGAAPGLELVRDWLGRERERPGKLAAEHRIALVRLLALAGDPSDRNEWIAWLRGSPEEIRALGWCGDAALIEPLLGALADCPAEGAGTRYEALADALHRLTGSSPEDASARPIEARVAVKVRFGSPFTPRASLDELLAHGVLDVNRRMCALEVAMASAGARRVDLDRWTTSQQADIAAARREIEHPEGAWIAARLTRPARR